MRLLDTSTLTHRECFGNYIPPYAILSHRWESSEVTFQELRDGKGPETAGWDKVAKCCAKAASDGWKYVWIDSCCIDKSSSAELSEAINSTFNWYSDAKICYAYLSDVASRGHDPYALDSEFRNSEWFTRGWTLQELLAPHYVEFCDRDWVEIGTKSSLKDLVTSITGITHLFNFNGASVAQKMSWSSRRETTRIEDQAYGLMGLFNINMPVLYGEGRNAFLRLQMEILSKTDDESIFAWSASQVVTGGLLAGSVFLFKDSGDVVRATFDPERPAYAMTNKGLRIELYITSWVDRQTSFLAPLNCTRDEQPRLPGAPQNWVALPLKLIKGQYGRYNFLKEYTSSITNGSSVSIGRRSVMYFDQRPIEDSWEIDWNRLLFIDPLFNFVVKFPSMEENGFSLSRYEIDRGDDRIRMKIRTTGKAAFESSPAPELVQGYGNAAAVLYSSKCHGMWVLVLGVSHGHAWIESFVLSKPRSLNEIARTSWVEHSKTEAGPDRISRRLKDGKFISAALKQALEQVGLYIKFMLQ